MQVKVCNFRSSEFNRDFVESVVNTGFAVITHHGIDNDLIRETQRAWRDFFNQSKVSKNFYVNPKDSNMGYMGFGVETAVGSNKADIKEFYHFKPGEVLPEGEASVLTMKLFNLLEDVSGKVLYVLDEIQNTNYRQACQGSDNTIMRALYYPSLDAVDYEEGSVRSAAHEDINFITLLVAATSPGLEVLDKNGKWHQVPYEDNSIVVNIGDMLQLASKGLFKSTTHRVVNPENYNQDRISIPLFVHPKSDTLLAQGVTAQQYLDERLNKIYKKVKKG